MIYKRLRRNLNSATFHQSARFYYKGKIERTYGGNPFSFNYTINEPRRNFEQKKSEEIERYRKK
jgi:hypothetical protein